MFWMPEKEEVVGTYCLKPDPRAMVGPEDQEFMMGGVIVGAIIEALEAEFEKPLLWISSQFLAPIRNGEPVSITIEMPPRVGSIVQTGALVKIGDQRANIARAGLGARSSDTFHFAQMPEVKPPTACETKPPDAGMRGGNISSQLEKRTAFQSDEFGIEHLWVRPLSTLPRSAGLLAIVADFFLGAHSLTRTGTSLDNLFRLHAVKQTEWVLMETKISSIFNGVVHGEQWLFAEDGTLLATASQTGLLPRRPAA